MKKSLLFAILVLTVPSFAMAHISVRPRDSKPGAEERYTVRVPTEGAVATTHVQLEIPADVTVLEVLLTDGATFETAKQGDRMASITWKKAIPPKESAGFVFRARNPSSSEIVWKSHQHFADGTTADWVDAAGERSPAAVTKLASTNGAAGQAAGGDAAAIETWLKGYDAAFIAKDLEMRATFYHPDVTIYEGGGINVANLPMSGRSSSPKPRWGRARLTPPGWPRTYWSMARMAGRSATRTRPAGHADRPVDSAERLIPARACTCER